LAAQYIAEQYGTSVNWAIVGRRESALKAVREELSQINSSLKDLNILVASASNKEELTRVARSTRVVLSTVGPFARYGTLLVSVCASEGTSYCDITGEVAWVREMIDRYDDVARETNARVVHLCGHDSVPWDLLTRQLATQLASSDEKLVKVNIYDEINSAPSGGTIETLFNSLETPHQHKSKNKWDPLLNLSDGSKGQDTRSQLHGLVPSYSSDMKRWTGNFVMSPVNFGVVKRCNAVLRYGPHDAKLVYAEAKVYPGFMAAVIEFVWTLYFGVLLVLPPAKWIARACCLPKPSEGPSKKKMDEGFLKLTGFGTGSSGTKVTASIWFPTDPGYRDTARMLVESGLALALNSEKIDQVGGIWMPGCCQGSVLLDRLVNTGTAVSDVSVCGSPNKQD
jgi:short subunit dehydrogenase-like uncharacterized protein